MKTQRSCPDCGSPLPPDAPEGICPECLMKGGLEFQQDMTISVEPIETTGERDLPNPGDQFGEYRIERELGRGGMGAVYEAEQLETGRRVALKVLAHQLDSADARARFFREGRLAASINHPNSVYVYGTGEIEGTPVIVMELINGGTLQERVKKEGPLPVGEAVDAIIDVIAGLQAAQATGILHRDIKPANCFEDANGTVKVGDFGLSISTEARDEPNLTQEGVFLGTPAFSSPEQLRGEELNARSDIYSVGVTLFYLLTGRTPFEGKTTVQLFANVLEKAPPSPRDFRKDIPERLAKRLLRCLEKTPGERFSDYEELRRALVPFGSEAPVPAPIPLRFLAGAVDLMMLSVFTALIGFVTMGEMFPMASMGSFQSSGFLWSLVFGYLLMFIYFVVMESRWGFTMGKAVCRLRVVDANRNLPSPWKTLRRAVVYLVLPPVPVWTFHLLAVNGIISYGHTGVQMAAGYSYYLCLGLLFVSARQRNGLAALQDLVSGTRVIRKPNLGARPTMAAPDLEPVTDTETKPKVGSYHVLETLEKSADHEWVLAYDARLLRKVWIYVVAPGAPEVPKHLRSIGRVGRLRWITGRRSEAENWDAYEAPDGSPLLHRIREPQSWEHVRFWMLDLAEELAASERDGSRPALLSLDRVWITSEGRAKLLDLPVPGVEATGEVSAAADTFLSKVASASLEGDAGISIDQAIKAAIPLHARGLLENRQALAKPETVATNLKRLVHKPARVTRGRRAALIAGCLAFPFAGLFFTLLGTSMVQTFTEQEPQLMEMNQVLSYRNTMNSPWMKNAEGPEDRLYAIFFSREYRSFVEDTDRWNSLYAMSLINGKNRIFVEESLRDYPSPTDEAFAEAKLALKPILEVNTSEQMKKLMSKPWIPFFIAGSVLLFYVAFPAILAALCFRGGLVLLTLGVGVVRKDGRRASRLRVFWRSLVTWLPFMVLVPLILALLGPLIGEMWSGLLVSLMAVGVTIFSVLMPERGLPDRLSGTRLVPR